LRQKRERRKDGAPGQNKKADVRGDEKPSLPPWEVLQEIKKFAESRKIGFLVNFKE